MSLILGFLRFVFLSRRSVCACYSASPVIALEAACLLAKTVSPFSVCFSSCKDPCFVLTSILCVQLLFIVIVGSMKIPFSKISPEICRTFWMGQAHLLVYGRRHRSVRALHHSRRLEQSLLSYQRASWLDVPTRERVSEEAGGQVIFGGGTVGQQTRKKKGSCIVIEW